ncbi:efflux RND transporter periplasmic adaptor subunit [Pseudomonas sp. S 311-6]|nr:MULTISPECIES: efflux RND transporter periplasmic adaptor subunit [Pseudomonas]MCO7641152.1 efflux RND transporter periplasmic adaptor subunit [Pseudomonas sp. S 311-6]
MFISIKGRVSFLVGLFGVAILALGGYALFGKAVSQAEPAEPVSVEVRAAASRQVSEWAEYSGRLEAIEHVEIRPRVAGTLLAVHFRDGQLVRKGDVLFTLDPAPFRAELKRAEAVLAQALERQRFTARELERGQRLLKANAIAKRDFDALENAALEARTSVQAARAVVERARLDVDYTRITAPIAGRISRPEITAGNEVKAGGDAPPLTSIVNLDPLYAAFTIDERTYLRYVSARRGTDPLQVQAGLAGEDGYPHAGQLYSLDNQLDTRTGTLRVRALLANPDGRLVPGLQARVRIQVSDPYPATLVDEAVIATDQDRRFVLLVGKDNRVEHRRLELGSRQGDQRVVLKGLAPGERVIVEGAQRVRPGDLVRVVQAAPALASE